MALFDFVCYSVGQTHNVPYWRVPNRSVVYMCSQRQSKGPFHKDMEPLQHASEQQQLPKEGSLCVMCRVSCVSCVVCVVCRVCRVVCVLYVVSYVFRVVCSVCVVCVV